MKVNDLTEYDVAFSFSGEDRDYVEQVAEVLRQSGIRIFYDKFEEAVIWGKDLYDYLSEVYQKKARFTVMFVSTAYAHSVWPNHERQNAQARALRENAEYILPVRFDDTPVPGLRETIGYIDLKNRKPSDLATLITKKIEIAIQQDKIFQSSTDKVVQPDFTEQFLHKFISRVGLEEQLVLYALRYYSKHGSGLADDDTLFNDFFLNPWETIKGPLVEEERSYLKGYFDSFIRVLNAMELVFHDGEAEMYLIQDRLIKAIKFHVLNREQTNQKWFEEVIKEMQSRWEWEKMGYIVKSRGLISMDLNSDSMEDIQQS